MDQQFTFDVNRAMVEGKWLVLCGKECQVVESRQYRLSYQTAVEGCPGRSVLQLVSITTWGSGLVQLVPGDGAR